MCDCAIPLSDDPRPAPWFVLPTPANESILAQFNADHLTSDGGLLWLARADAELGLGAALAACIPEWRRGPVRHSLATLVRQRVFQIACGYADQNDADSLRTDPLLKLACGRLPESGADLSSQPTLSRLETAVDRRATTRGLIPNPSVKTYGTPLLAEA